MLNILKATDELLTDCKIRSVSSSNFLKCNKEYANWNLPYGRDLQWKCNLDIECSEVGKAVKWRMDQCSQQSMEHAAKCIE